MSSVHINIPFIFITQSITYIIYITLITDKQRYTARIISQDEMVYQLKCELFVTPPHNVLVTMQWVDYCHGTISLLINTQTSSNKLKPQYICQHIRTNFRGT